jgi:hypothetical protein
MQSTAVVKGMFYMAILGHRRRRIYRQSYLCAIINSGYETVVADNLYNSKMVPSVEKKLPERK